MFEFILYFSVNRLVAKKPSNNRPRIDPANFQKLTDLLLQAKKGMTPTEFINTLLKQTLVQLTAAHAVDPLPVIKQVKKDLKEGGSLLSSIQEFTETSELPTDLESLKKLISAIIEEKENRPRRSA